MAGWGGGFGGRAKDRRQLQLVAGALVAQLERALRDVQVDVGGGRQLRQLHLDHTGDARARGRARERAERGERGALREAGGWIPGAVCRVVMESHSSLPPEGRTERGPSRRVRARRRVLGSRGGKCSHSSRGRPDASTRLSPHVLERSPTPRCTI
eukprot:1563226-Prymnesium_polylepis.1